MTSSWKTLVQQAITIGGPQALRSPASADAIGQAAVPASYRLLWLAHDGQGDTITGLFEGYDFMRLAGVDSVMASQEELRYQGFNDYFPIAKDYSGSFLAIGPDGACYEIYNGQVLPWADDVHGLCHRAIVAGSLKADTHQVEEAEQAARGSTSPAVLDQKRTQTHPDSSPHDTAVCLQTADLVGADAVTWVSEDHVLVRLTVAQARQGTLVVLPGTSIGVRLPAAARDGAVMKKVIDGRKITIQATILTDGPT